MKLFSFLLLACLVLGCGGSTKDAQKTNQLPQVVFSGDIVAFGLADVELIPSTSDSDGTIVSYTWQQTSGLTIELVENRSPKFTFIAPDITYGEEEQQLTFQLTVQDNDGGEASASVTVIVKPLLTVNAGEDQSLFIGESVDIACDTLLYQGVDYHLIQTSGPQNIQISTRDNCVASLSQFKEAGEYLFTLEASDNEQTASDDIQINVDAYTGQLNEWLVPSELAKIATISKDLAPAKDLKAYGNYLYASSEDSVTALAVDEDGNLVEHQRLENIDNLYIKDDYAFGLIINSESSVVSSYKLTSGLFEHHSDSLVGNLSDNAKIVAFEQQLLMISDDSFLSVYRVNESGIELVDKVAGIPQQKLKKIIVIDKVLYVQTYGVDIYKINESSLEFIDDIFYGGFDYGGIIEDFNVEQQQLFVIGYEWDRDGTYDSQLEVYDITDINNVSYISQVQLPSHKEYTQIALANNFVYVLVGERFYIFSSNNGVLEHIYDANSHASSILSHNGFVYLSSDSDIQVVDVHNFQPELLCHYATGSTNTAIKAIVDGNAYFFGSDGKLLIVPVSQLHQACTPTTEQSVELARIDSSLLLENEHTLLIPTKNNTIELWSLSSNDQLVKQPEIITTSINKFPYSPKVVTSAKHIFYTDSDNSIAIAPREQLANKLSVSIEVEQTIDAMAIDSNRLLIAAGKSLYLYDISDVEAPKLKSQLDELGTEGGNYAQSIRIEGDRAFVRPILAGQPCHWTNDRVGVYIIDISNSEQLMMEKVIAKDACQSYGYTVIDNILYSLEQFSLDLYNMNIKEYSTWSQDYQGRGNASKTITKVNDVVALMNQNPNSLGFQVVTLSETNDLERIAYLPFITDAKLTADNDNILFVTMPNLGVYVVDMSSPKMPKLLGWTHNRADNLLVGNDTLYFLRDEDLSTSSYVSAKSKQWFQDNVLINNDFHEVALGGEITYNVSWKDDSIDKIDCQVTAGSCQLTAFDKQAKVATVQWNLPAETGEHQILINGGNDEQYATQSDLVLVN